MKLHLKFSNTIEAVLWHFTTCKKIYLLSLYNREQLYAGLLDLKTQMAVNILNALCAAHVVVVFVLKRKAAYHAGEKQ